MSRKKLCLCQNIGFSPELTYFKPQGVPLCDLVVNELTIEELESLRLHHTKNLEQIEGATKMRISQSTFQRILNSAYQKVVDALINGKAIKITRHEEVVN